MECQQARALWPDYSAGTLGRAEGTALAAHLDGCPACRSELDTLGALWTALGALPDEPPSASLQARFDQMMDAYRDGMGEASPRRERGPRSWLDAWSPARLVLQGAFAALFLVAGFLGGRSLGPSAGGDRQVAELREEVGSMRRLVALSLLQQDSAADRLSGITWSHRLEQPDREVLRALIDTLNTDANVNVRLSAIEALGSFGREEHVRLGLIEAMVRQDSPLVQIALIDLLVRLQERRSVEALRALIARNHLDTAVRQRVDWGLRQLG